MREKTPKTVLTFSNTPDAIAFEAASRQDAAALPGRIVPVPSQISAGCGLAWCSPEEERDTLLAVAEAKGLAYEGVYTVPMY